MNIVTVIPARGGSKSIPLKNIQLLNGKPLVAYTIEYSNQCNLVSHTVVSTDSDAISDIAKTYNAEVPFIRPTEISADETQDFPVIKHALITLEKIYQKKIDAIVWLRPTSPLRPKKLIERAVDILKTYPKCTSIRSVVKCTEHPYRQWEMKGDYMEGVIREVNESYNLPRQKLPDVYFQSGDIEVVRRETIINGSMSGDRVAPLLLEQEEMLDIDHYADLQNAELKFKAANSIDNE